MRFVRKLIMGVSHAAVQLIAGTLAMLLAVKVAGCFEWRGHLFNVMVVSGTALFGAIASGVVLGAYLMTWSLLPKVGTHDNEAFSALRSTKRKNFLRMQITGDGLDVHVLAVDKICRHWERGPEGELPRWNPASRRRSRRSARRASQRRPDRAPEVRQIDHFRISGPERPAAPT